MEIKKILIFCFSLALLFNLNAQENAIEKAMNKKKIVRENSNENLKKNSSLSKNWKISIGYGLTQFNGDVRQYNHYPAYNNKDNFYELRSAISISLKKQMNPFYSISGEIISGKFAGLRRANEYLGYSVYDPWKYYEGNGDKFVASFKEADLIFNLELSNLISFLINTNSKYSNKISFESKLGVGYNVFNSVRENLHTNTYIHDFGYENSQSSQNLGTNKMSINNQAKTTVYLYGLKAKYKINEKSDFWIDYTIRNAETDKWDASIMETQNKRDQFAFLSIGITYKIGKQKNLKEWHSPLEGLQNDVKYMSVNIEGFTSDRDNDGISDSFDKSPNTPIGVAVDGSGTALDVDMDNIPDYRDADPFSNRGAQVDENGVELDDDKDGVPNSKDLEANTLSGSMVNQFGINIDFSAKKDKVSPTYLPSIFFSSGSNTVEESNKNRLTIVALMLKKNKNIMLNVIGHTDEVGNTENNKKLGYQRAQAVINYLNINYGINENRLRAISKGEEDPLFLSIEKSKSVEIKSKQKKSVKINRRVDFEVIQD